MHHFLSFLHEKQDRKPNTNRQDLTRPNKNNQTIAKHKPLKDTHRNSARNAEPQNEVFSHNIYVEGLLNSLAQALCRHGWISSFAPSPTNGILFVGPLAVGPLAFAFQRRLPLSNAIFTTQRYFGCWTPPLLLLDPSPLPFKGGLLLPNAAPLDAMTFLFRLGGAIL